VGTVGHLGVQWVTLRTVGHLGYNGSPWVQWVTVGTVGHLGVQWVTLGTVGHRGYNGSPWGTMGQLGYATNCDKFCANQFKSFDVAAGRSLLNFAIRLTEPIVVVNSVLL